MACCCARCRIRTPSVSWRLLERAIYGGKSVYDVVSAPNFHDWRAQAKSVDLMAAFRGGESTVLGLAEPMHANVYAVSHDYFRLFGGTPMRGRTFAETRAPSAASPSRSSSNKFWREQLGGRARCVVGPFADLGRAAIASSASCPRALVIPTTQQLWIPLEPQNAAWGATVTQRRNGRVDWRPASRCAGAEAELTGNRRAIEEGVSDAQRRGRRASRRACATRSSARCARICVLLLLAVSRSVARRVRQPRERESRARRRSRARAGDSNRARRGARTPGAAATHREYSRRALSAARSAWRSRTGSFA